MARSMTDYAPVLSLPNTLVLKYEDMILRKELLIGHLARHFGMRASPQDISDILGWADKIPAAEDPRAFVRQVLPGDHRKKLDDATIGRLNEHLSAAMHLFGYAA